VSPPASTDRGRETAWSLAEIRTVLSRAQTALTSITECPTMYPALWEHDPDHAEMVAALTDVVDRLSPWRRTGRPTKTTR
jgi:hypothetical protein